MLFEASVEMLIFLWLLYSFQELLRGFGLVGVGVSICNMRVANTVCPLNP